MGVLVGDDRLERPAERRQRDGVGRRARCGETDIGIGVEQLAHQLGGLGGDHVGPIAGDEAVVEMNQGLQRLRRGAGGIVGGEVVAGHEVELARPPRLVIPESRADGLSGIAGCACACCDAGSTALRASGRDDMNGEAGPLKQRAVAVLEFLA